MEYINEQTDNYKLDGVCMKDISFGKGNIADNGCGVIAAYNVLKYANMPNDFARIKDDIIALKGLNFFGLLGARPSALKRYMRKHFSKVWSTYGKSKIWDNHFANADALIIILKWKWSFRMHYMAGVKGGQGFTFYNSGIDDGNEISIATFLEKVRADKATPIYCLGIKIEGT